MIDQINRISVMDLSDRSQLWISAIDRGDRSKLLVSGLVIFEKLDVYTISGSFIAPPPPTVKPRERREQAGGPALPGERPRLYA